MGPILRWYSIPVSGEHEPARNCRDMSETARQNAENEISPEGLPHGDVAQRVIAIVAALADELQPRNRQVSVTADTNLDRELGFDSLSRAELLLRIDRDFKVQLPERLLVEAETPRDLIAALSGAEAPMTEPADAIDLRDQAPVAEPTKAQTLIDVIDFHADRHGERPHILLRDRGAHEQVITYAALRGRAMAVAAGLLDGGCTSGDRVAIMLPTSAAFFEAFFGIVMAGCVPVPIYPPLRMSQLEDHLKRQAGILGNAGATVVITEERIRAVASMLGGLVESLGRVATVDELSRYEPLAAPMPVSAIDTALIQYTSGSTGDPKGVVLSHANLLANIRAMGAAAQVTPSDVFVSWLPLYHDMGLIGAWLGSLYFACTANILSPLTFLADPRAWLKAIARHRATLSASPNFGFELCLKRIEDADITGLDLSSLRMVVNGAEPIAPHTLKAFSKRFAKFGLKPGVVAPVYGLAETSVGLAFSPPGRLPEIDRIDRAAMSRTGEARPAAAGDTAALEFVGCGSALPGHEVRIVDDAGRELPDRRQGRLEFRGPSTTSGYFHNAEKTRALIDGDWLDSGDLAYVVGGEIFITGRIKDIIIRAGRNIYPHELEERVGDLENVRKGSVVVFPSTDRRTGTERLVVVAETRQNDEAAREQIRTAVADAALEILDLPPDDIVVAPPHTVPKTSSGKIRRNAARMLYETGTLAPDRRVLFWQLFRLSFSSAGGRILRLVRRAGASLYAGYWWGMLCLIATVVWPLVVALPARRWRHATVGALARLFLRTTGTRLHVEGRENIPARNVVIVTNHASYLDSLVLCAAISGMFSFVAKRELASQWVAGPFLRRLGSLFVRRDNRQGGVADTKVGIDAARRGERLVWFAEGTLHRQPGLMDFHLGPFLTAVEAGVPVLPLAIRGTRSVLRGGQWFPRRGAIEVRIAAAIEPQGEEFASAIELRDRSRRAVLERCGEPDLAGRR